MDRSVVAMLDQLEDAFFVLDPDLSISVANRAAGLLCGVAPAELAAKPLGEVMRLEGAAVTLEAIAKKAITEGAWRGEVESIAASGRRLWGEWRWRRIIDNALPGALLLCVRDITELRRAHQALVDSEQKYRAFVEQSAEGYTVVDRHGRVVEWNQAQVRLSGIERERALGRPLWELMLERLPPSRRTPEHLEALRSRIATLLAEEAPLPAAPIEFEVAGDRIFQQSLFRIAVADERWIGSISRETTAERRAAAMQRQREELFRVATEQTRQIVYDYDLASRRIRWMGAVEAVTGRSPEQLEAFGLDEWSEHVHPDDRALTLALLEDAERRATTFSAQYRYRREDGSYTLVEDDGQFILGASGAPVRLIGAMRDVSERKQAELERERLADQLRQMQKMESIGRLAGGVAHDFNNLLTAVSGNTELALMEAPEGSEMREYLSDVLRAADSGAALTRQLLAFSRREVIRPQVVSLNELVERVHTMLRRLIGEDINMRVFAAPGLWPVKADPGQLEQILVNLVVNARDAMPNGGTILIETANVHFDATYCRTHALAQPGEHVMLSVTDTGPGMSEEACRHVFEPFYEKHPREPLGLGLATVYGAVQQNHGSVEVYSELGRGTSFKVYLPQTAAAVEDARAGALSSLLHGSETVLLVEDDRTVRQVATDMLKRLGYEVIACADPAGALAVARDPERRFDLLMTDVVMPGMNGRALAEEIAKLRPDLRVLYASGYTQNTIAHHGVLDPGIQFVPKPYSLDALAHALREALGRD